MIDSALGSDEISDIAEEAYVYAFPMLMFYRATYALHLQPALPTYVGPVNSGPFGKAVTLDHTFKEVISPNADTPYSFGILDLRAGPVVLTVPEVADRYYVMQLENIVGYNEHYIGSRSTGSAAGSYLFVGPRWEGELPEGFDSTFHFETDLVVMIGRSQLLGSDDQERLAKIMAKYRLEPLDVYQGGEAPALDSLDWPAWDDEASRDERFISYVNFLLGLCEPVHPDEVDLFKRFARVGIGSGLAFDPDALNTENRAAIAAGVSSARKNIADAARSMGASTDGWMVVDPFGDREFYAGDFMKRAAATMVGWGGNDRIEAHYPMARADVDGNPFDGNAKYQLTLGTRPPVNAFWSVTMYDTTFDGTAGYMVENPIGRYLINSTTEGLAEDDDGGLTITMQRDEPTDPKERANWLPTPDGSFYLALRLYWPKPAALNGEWNPPPVVRIG